MQMEIGHYKQDRFCIIQVKGRMDAVSAPEFEKRCAERMEQGESTFVVDLEGLEYISSAGLRSILVVAKKLKSGNGSIVFCSLKPTVEKVFSISGFNSLFTMHKFLQDAIASA